MLPPCTPALARAKTRERVARLRIRRKLKAIRDAKAERDGETRIKVDFSYGSNPKAKKERAVRSKERQANSTPRPLRRQPPPGGVLGFSHGRIVQAGQWGIKRR